MNNGGKGLLLLIGTPAALIALVAFLVVFSFGGGSAAAACGTMQGGSVDVDAAAKHAPIDGFSGDQLKNAAYIMNAAEALGLTQQAQVIGIMTAIGESTLQVLDRGDAAGPDSRGLFQQRGNGAWGSYEDRMNPTTSATNFFKALQKVDGWEDLEPTIAIHRVQINQDPFHYRQYQSAAQDIVTQLSGGSGGSTAAPVSSSSPTPTPSASATPGAPAPTNGCSAGGTVLPLTAPFDMTDDFGPRQAPTAGASSWHPADDLQTRVSGSSSGKTGYSCGSPVYAAQAGTVTVAAGYTLSIKSAEGYTISYLHMYPPDMMVAVGDAIASGQQIGKVGSNGPSTGCHLDIRIDAQGSTNSDVSDLPESQSLGGPVTGYVDPEKFFNVFGVTLCGDDCKRNYTE
ncbi:M23 family metallopeptidase [Curtobacterium sp. VKM Ac-1395]|uniref:M23 family metallopeptidase n=1 Tax=Curtobacterium sp. VKM Ac-1395 TaxID=2783815 RepID=UPI00188AB824|nr:M23 family metallopeptidase [Curtobacterium sp. VKM Ac-1395]MBF4592083.1 M23 family metallopeptidase [Curtobacterium sp. VKM Ac-1395]